MTTLAESFLADLDDLDDASDREQDEQQEEDDADEVSPALCVIVALILSPVRHSVCHRWWWTTLTTSIMTAWKLWRIFEPATDTGRLCR